MNTKRLFCFCCGREVFADKLLEEGETTTVCCDEHYGTKEQRHEWMIENLYQWSTSELMTELYDLVTVAGHIESLANEERRFLAAIGEDARDDDDDSVAWSRIQTFDKDSLIGAIESYWEKEESE